MEKLEFQRIGAGSVYKLVFTGFVCGFLPLCIIFGVLALFGMNTVTLNGQPVTGPSALILGPLLGVILSLVFTAIFGSIIALGLWIFARFKPMDIYVFPAIHNSVNGQR